MCIFEMGCRVLFLKNIDGELEMEVCLIIFYFLIGIITSAHNDRIKNSLLFQRMGGGYLYRFKIMDHVITHPFI